MIILTFLIFPTNHRAYNDNLDIAGAIEDWFDFDQNACRILPSILLKLIRNYYPREEDRSVYYPPPFSDAGGAYPLEFVNLVGNKESCRFSTTNRTYKS